MSTTQTSTGERSRRSDAIERHANVIDAYVDLVLDGDLAPSPAAVAARADVSRASLFRYFASLDELRNAAMGRVFERFLHLFDLGKPPATRSDRIATFVNSRLRFHAELHPLALLQRRHAPTNDVAAAHIEASRQLLADQLSNFFEDDLHNVTPARRDDVVTTIAVLTSVESWHQSTQSHGRTPAQTRRAWIATISALLADVTFPQGDPS